MLVFYSEWGYWECYGEIDGQCYRDQGETIKACDLFELPKDKEREIYYLGKATVDCLLPSSYLQEKCYPPPAFGVFEKITDLQFILCEKWEYNRSKEYYE